MITLEQYFLDKDHTHDQELSAMMLLARVESLLAEAMLAQAYSEDVNPKTGSQISGETEGGFRTPDSTTGAPHSAHREAKAVDIYDPDNRLDDWITDECLVKYDLYREAPGSTHGWTHLQCRPTLSGHRTFLP